jgi:lipoate-protein ligase A
MLHELDVYHDAEPRSAALNMAIDEALLESASRPALRFYRWRQPALSFGYFVPYAAVAAEAEGRELVRRWTGGGIVRHGEDQTYSVILPQKYAAEARSARAIYAALHGAIQRALAGSLEAVLAQEDAPKISDACFANPVVADVLVNGRKIAGAAQRRTRAGLLHQGSIQWSELPRNFANSFATAICPHHHQLEFKRDLLERAAQIARQKYATSAWLRRR